MSLVSPAIVSTITVVGVKQVDVLVVVTGQELCTDIKKLILLISIKAGGLFFNTGKIQTSSAALLILDKLIGHK